MKILENIFEDRLLSELKEYPITQFKKGDVLIEEYNQIEFIPILLEGMIKVMQKDHNEVSRLIYHLFPGESCILSLIAGQKKQPSIGCGVASKDSKVILVSPDTTKRWYEEYSSWRDFISKLYDVRLNDLIHQRNLVEEQRVQIQLQKEEITNSINYSKRIHDTLVQSESLFKRNITNSFVINRPKDIVSGDFLWSKRIGKKTFFAVADCTGHGVPGSMVSVICSYVLNDELSHSYDEEVGDVLNKLRERVQEVFSSEEQEIRDGMDISLCSLDTETNVLSYSGANSSIYLVSDYDDDVYYRNSVFVMNGKMVCEYKGNHQPIGKVENPSPFRTQKISIKKNDSLYLTSDGFYHQFGGEKGKKLSKRKMKEAFILSEKLPSNERLSFLESQLDNWKGRLEQTDDILMVGIKY